MDPTNSTTPTPSSEVPVNGATPESSSSLGATTAGVGAGIASNPVNVGAGAEIANNPVSSGVVGAPTPVNPIINPTGGGVNQNMGAGVIIQDTAPAPAESVAVNTGPSNPVFQPSRDSSLTMAATDPIMMPEKAPEPDPVEEELKAPMKAAGPVPGSIGSAVSVPADNSAGPAEVNPVDGSAQGEVPSVAFNDPAKQEENPMARKTGGLTGKKMNKKTMIALIAVAGVVVLVLVIVLVMSLMG